MSIAYYMDEHVAGAITRGLQRRAVDVLTVQDDNLMSADDPIILDRATALGRTVFTRDNDFLREAQLRQAAGLPFAGVVFAHQQGPGIGRCISDLEIIAKVYDPIDMANKVEYLPL
jgi:hypothetical protein